jgi:tetratricopeptide (TPR) repeat protein
VCSVNIYEWAHHKYTFGTALLELARDGAERDLRRAADAFQSAIDERAVPLSIVEYYSALVRQSESYIILSERAAPAKLSPTELKLVGDTVSTLSWLTKNAQMEASKEGHDRIKVLLARSLTEYGLRLYGVGNSAESERVLRDANNAIGNAMAVSSNETKDLAVLEYDRARVMETAGIIENDRASREKAKQVYERAKDMATAAAAYDLVERAAADIYIEWRMRAKVVPCNLRPALQKGG